MGTPCKFKGQGCKWEDTCTKDIDADATVSERGRQCVYISYFEYCVQFVGSSK